MQANALVAVIIPADDSGICKGKDHCKQDIAERLSEGGRKGGVNQGHRCGKRIYIMNGNQYCHGGKRTKKRCIKKHLAHT